MKSVRDKIIKVCGMREAENIRDVSILNPNLMGFIFYEPSPRSAHGISREIIDKLPESIEPIAVFVDETIEEVIKITSHYGIKTVQLHGKESSGYCKELKEKGYKVIKAFRINDELPENLSEYCDSVDLFLFDTAGKAAGGNGRKFDWSILESYDLPVPYLLSGGIAPEDSIELNKKFPKGCIGVDINSKFEDYPGHKNTNLLFQFFKEFKKNEPIR